jgi:hypothetical protein
LDEIGNAEFGDGADRATEGGADQDAAELFGFLLGHEFHLECCGTLSHGKTEPQAFNLPVADNSEAMARWFESKRRRRLFAPPLLTPRPDADIVRR